MLCLTPCSYTDFYVVGMRALYILIIIAGTDSNCRLSFNMVTTLAIVLRRSLSTYHLTCQVIIGWIDITVILIGLVLSAGMSRAGVASMDYIWY